MMLGKGALADVAVVVPARGGSRRIRRKNVRPFLGVPLVSLAVRWCLEEGFRPWVATDDAEIGALAVRAGAAWLREPRRLAGPRTTMVELMRWAARKVPCRAVAVVPPTAPLREAGVLRRCVERWRRGDVASVWTGCRSKAFVRGADGAVVWPPFGRDGRRPFGQELPEVFTESSVVHLVSVCALADGCADYIVAPSAMVETSPAAHADLDTEEDWALAEAVARGRA